MSSQEKKKQWIQNEQIAISDPLETESFDVGSHYHVELIMSPPDVIFHLFRYGKDEWPRQMKERIIEAMDKQVSDNYTAGYERVADSWFIRIFDFCASRITPRHAAKGIIQEVVKGLIQKEIDDGTIRIPGH